ncbi:hypothetical protein K431DRAFT_304318 [Polychaeton citri CBS 116435]|uniref:Uncharacterized protein n=1 Tax=Polychaeton citri CBS 116435 TaxID=1314669 RepID=A0A9P4Q8V5_9PEZI|nr:hypothetical protein K431DRAFT_304318 [Polychaeton citri CBS 116435]
MIALTEPRPADCLALLAIVDSVFALPGGNVETLDLAKPGIVQRDSGILYSRTDEDWLLVVYEEPSGSTEQCGGTDESYTGSVAGSCLSMAAKCIDFSVSLTAAAAGMKCEAKFDSTKCGNSDGGSVTVDAGKSTRGYNPGDKVKFVQVECSEQ